MGAGWEFLQQSVRRSPIASYKYIVSRRVVGYEVSGS